MVNSNLSTIRKLFGWKGKIIIFIVICFFIFLIKLQFHNTYKAKDNVMILFKKGSFSIGEIDGVDYSGGATGGYMTDIIYSYDINNKKYSNYLNSFTANEISKESKNIYLSFDNSHKGERYLVIFEENNPKNSILCLDRPIKDSLNYMHYITDIKAIQRNK